MSDLKYKSLYTLLYMRQSVAAKLISLGSDAQSLSARLARVNSLRSGLAEKLKWVDHYIAQRQAQPEGELSTHMSQNQVVPSAADSSQNVEYGE